MADLHKKRGEVDLIQTYLAPLSSGAPGAFGLRDDCASLTPPDGMDLVLSTDAVISGVHFLADENPAVIAWKALGINVSDIVSKGASPHVYLMNLSLPDFPTEDWLHAFTTGLASAQDTYGCHLTGGDTDKTPGPLSVSITLVGIVPRGQMVRRATAQPGDVVFVTGPIGNATLGLRIAQDEGFAKRAGLSGDNSAALEASFRQPQPDIAVADLLVRYASSAMDVSDGLIKDFHHMCAASDCGGRLDLRRMPVSDAAKVVLHAGGTTRVDLARGGEDYVVLGCAHENSFASLVEAGVEAGITITPIGQMQPIVDGIQVVDETGELDLLHNGGWDHFAE